MHINVITANLKQLILEKGDDRDDIFSDVVAYVSEIMDNVAVTEHELKEEIRKLKFMVDNGLDHDDLINDVTR